MSYSDVSGHRAMVFDGLRNAAYARALAGVIGPDTTVMDLGAGLGVHGLNAARLGAAAVHLVEPSPVLEVARMIASDNNLDNVQCHPCRVEELELQAPVDVIISVFTGNFLFSEDLLPSLFYARDTYLAPGGRMIPDRACMEVVPVCMPGYYREHIDCWARLKGAGAEGLSSLDYRAVRSYAANTVYFDTRKNFEATLLAEPATLLELDFSVATRASCDSETELTVTQDSVCHGWLGWFRMRLGDEWLSTGGEPGATHWSPAFLPLEQPLQLRSGERLGFALKRPEFGEWTWTTRHGQNQQRQSTFLSRPVTPQRMLKASEQYCPVLNQRGEAARWLLAEMAGAQAVGQLAARAFTHFPGAFISAEEALAFTRALALRCAE